jgi:hypothetical protein
LTNNPAGGRIVNQRVIAELQLSGEQTESLNKIVRNTERDISSLEVQHTGQSVDGRGHVHVLTQPFPAEAQKVSGQMWKDLAEVLNAPQLAAAHKLKLERLVPLNSSRLVEVELWKDSKGQYYFTDTQKDPGTGETISSRSQSGTNPGIIPPRFRAYLPNDK